MAVSLGLHGLAVVAALMAFSPQRLSMDDFDAITVYLESDPLPVAVAGESRSVVAPTLLPLPLPLPLPDPEPEPETAAALEPPKEQPLADFAPPPPAELPLPDFSAPSPPPPKQEAKPEPKRAAPVVARPAPVPGRPAAAAPAPPAASASAPAAAAAPSAPATVVPGWNALLAAWLAANRRYPDEARRRHEEGEVTVRFTVAGDGRVLEAALVKGSGVASLDAAAVRLLQGATLPAPGIEATRTVRIRFRLND